MIFHNGSPNVLRFEVGGVTFEVAPGEECDIAPNYAYVVASRGLPLTEGTMGGKRVEGVVERVAQPAPMPGVETFHEADDEEEDAEPVAQVEAAAAKLRAQGALPKGRRR